MRGHKFIILVGDSQSAFTWFNFDSNIEITHQIVWNEDEYLQVVSLPHENFLDNVIELKNDSGSDEVSVVRDVDGKLWYYMDYMSKMDVIKQFEQTD